MSVGEWVLTLIDRMSANCSNTTRRASLIERLIVLLRAQTVIVASLRLGLGQAQPQTEVQHSAVSPDCRV